MKLCVRFALLCNVFKDVLPLVRPWDARMLKSIRLASHGCNANVLLRHENLGGFSMLHSMFFCRFSLFFPSRSAIWLCREGRW